jgi:hypothetical protein
MDILALLNDQEIHIRLVDEILKQLTLSKPTSVNSGFVIGLRYIKRDESHTEDLFSAEQGEPIKANYKGSLEKQWPEYRDTHKQPLYDRIASWYRDLSRSIRNTPRRYAALS